ncbi:unnamed protein product [Rotaria sordida]|uniref:Phosphatase and actin regulator n=1 Tax=Rotaria sordida TaxID=392033 RepID=A0A814BAQ4_9BILA|nr:unnamed protein product [Rotaria sordida]CAF0980965.1 unnamed protein product [Rotaria sordida]CAF3646528.1 unnamed protein product [Rotaria sordida]CAF3701550.1 unnamed protein product [Rotaria sordida]
MTSKPIQSSSPTQSKYLYENKYEPQYDQSVNIHWNSYSKTDRRLNSSYFQRSTLFNRSYDHINIPYASNVYGVYRRPPSNIKSPLSIYTNPSKCNNQRSKSYHSQPRQLSHSISDDYYYQKHDDLNGLINAIYGDAKKNENNKYEYNEENCSNVFNYTFANTGDVILPMATYENVGLINTPNINNNNNNNNNNLHSLSTPLTRDSYDYSSTTYNQQINSKSSTMPKDHYQNATITTKHDIIPSENETNYLTPSDIDSTIKSNETTKRINNTNGKFSLQKMIRQGFSSWRTRKKPPSLSTPPTSTISTNFSTPSSPPSSTKHYMAMDNDLSQTHPSTTIRSMSTDLVSNPLSSQRIIVTEQIAPPTIRSNSVDCATVDFDRPSTNIRGYIQSPWANSSTSMTSNTNTTESISSRPEPLSTSRTLPTQFIENTKTLTPLSIGPASVNVSTTTETTNSTTPLIISSINSSKIPPPVAPKPDINRFTPIRSNYLNNNLSSSSTTTPTPFSPSTSNTIEQRHVAFSNNLISNQFKPINDIINDNNIIYANINPSNTILKEKFQIYNSPVNNRNTSSPTLISNSINEKQISNTTNNISSSSSSSSSTNSSSTPIIQTTKQSIIQDIDTTKYEEIPAKEPDLSRQPEKSALKKPNGIKRRVIPVFRENQRPSPRPSPKLQPVILLSPSSTIKTVNNEENTNSDENSSSDEENYTPKKRFANVQRNDSLARFLKDRPLPDELYDKHILVKSFDERKNERENIETKLERKLSLRPRPEELEARNILRAKTQAELMAEKEEKKRYLIRKLSFRPSIQELRDRKIIRFCDYIEVSDCDDVDRRADKPWTRLTQRDKQLIRRELNEYKSSEMEIHPESAKYTRFHPP